MDQRIHISLLEMYQNHLQGSDFHKKEAQVHVLETTTPCMGNWETKVPGHMAMHPTRQTGKKKNVPPALCPVGDNPLYWVKYRKGYIVISPKEFMVCDFLEP